MRFPDNVKGQMSFLEVGGVVEVMMIIFYIDLSIKHLSFIKFWFLYGRGGGE